MLNRTLKSLKRCKPWLCLSAPQSQFGTGTGYRALLQTGRQGDSETGRQEDSETVRQGQEETQKDELIIAGFNDISLKLDCFLSGCADDEGHYEVKWLISIYFSPFQNVHDLVLL